jgi:hypothetical protein
MRRLTYNHLSAENHFPHPAANETPYSLVAPEITVGAIDGCRVENAIVKSKVRPKRIRDAVRCSVRTERRARERGKERERVCSRAESSRLKKRECGGRVNKE